MTYDPEDLVAVKLHFGEEGLDTFVRPVLVAPIVEKIKGLEGKPFLTDSNTLYVGSRSNAVDHLDTAQKHGWLRPVVDAPVIIADGLHGNEFYRQSIEGKHFDKVKLAAAFQQCSGIVGVSHFKGHIMTGFGGTLKNLGMGCASRAGKLMMHYDVRPEIDTQRCTACGRCVDHCPGEAIEVGEYAIIDHDRCIGCGECKIICTQRAVKVNEASSNEKLQEKIAEFAHGSLIGKRDRSLFFNFLVDITPECDCPPWRKKPLVSDIGVLASRDPVAIDQASLDLVNEAAREDVFRRVHGVDPCIQLEHGERIGMGTREYELIDLSQV